MSILDNRERELVAIGAAMGSNCVPCIEYHIEQAKKAGLSEAAISEAIAFADKIRQVPAEKVLEAAHRKLASPGSEETVAPKACCQPAAVKNSCC